MSLLVCYSLVGYADSSLSVLDLQHEWAKVNYQLKGKEQKEAFGTLLISAENAVQANPDSAELIIWRGIIESSYAGIKGGLGALSLVKKAKSDFEKALTINDQALAGSAYTSLGTLYYKVPGWPIGFGDDDKAEALLKKSLAINPNGIDSNYFFGDYLMTKHKWSDAEQYLLKAQQASPRPDRPVADSGRQNEIKQALEKVRTQINIAAHDNFIN